MGKRISIALPDELYERLQAVKSEFNISGLCQDAIESEIVRQEFFKKGTIMENTIKRLSDEKRASIKADEERVERDGYEDAQSMSYSELISLEKTEAKFGKESDEFVDIIRELPCYQDWLENERVNHSDNDHFVDEGYYLPLWAEGVMRFWREVRSKI
jgi:predicted DNA-binding protein